MCNHKNLWSREELILTFNLYLQLPFGKLHKGRKEVKNLAKIINRSDNAVALRLVNFAACDPYLKKRGIQGMAGGSKQCQPIWDEFFNNTESLLFESEQILAKFQNTLLEEKFNFSNEIDPTILGEEREYYTKNRVNQYVFRNIILANYDNQCAISGIDMPDLLVASHIIPWAENKKERLNPTNGICLSTLYDKAFDSGLITFSDEYRVVFSPYLKRNFEKAYYNIYFKSIENKEIIFPKKYNPNKGFLKWHRENIFQSS